MNIHKLGGGMVLALAVGAWACGGSTHASSANASTAPSSGSSASPAMGALSDSGGTPIGQAPPDFPSLEADRWVNGAPMSLASAHGDVVLVESWHRL